MSKTLKRIHIPNSIPTHIQVQEKVVEKVVEVEKDMGGATEHDVAALEERMKEEKAKIQTKVEEEKKAIEDQKNLAEEEKQRLVRRKISRKRRSRDW